MAEVESRFLHLLQPIRDLTKNWEVDVAAQLGEYLEELDQICISFDNGKTTMNFIEAALLIQGSACIYSRKVEYLYLLVYQMLDFISNKKREKQPSSLGQDGKDTDASFGADKEEQFLSLDDIGDSSHVNMDMKKDHQPKTVNVIPLTPMCLVPLEEADKRDNPLFSRNGEILASRKDFRMNMSTPHTTGAFLLEPAGLSPICPQEQHLEVSPGRAAAGAPSCVLSSRRDRISTGRAPVQALSFSTDRGATGPDDADSRDDNMPGALEDDVEMTVARNEHIEVQRSMPRTKGYMLRERAPAEDPKARLKEMLDPWQSLDPFGDSEDKPFKKGRPFLVPRGLDDVVGGKRKRKGPRKLQDFMEWFSAAYNNITGSRKTRRKGPTFADLEVLYWKEQKLRMAAQRKLQSQAEPLGPLPHEEELDLLEEERGADCDEGAGDFMEYEDIQAEGPEELGEGALGPPDLGSLGYEELVRRNVELFIANSQKYTQETELSQHIRRWEERIGPLLQEQEERATFDIHGYGDTLASSCRRLGEWRSFASLVAGEPPFEVCRYMLATLQLANDSVVELAQGPGLEEALDTARLRFLTHQRPQERFHTFQPPSACP
ncbi:condensin-2 complex subunit H2 isoform X1 [Accipiter gentilis]|uniref:condensin-2 complex subunit H2 isoform X1 n=2 Tax=Astur gentilis TaxID=8957 RepID=UPI00210F5897|nr:condensin-2 complex subunit H2 isoform X1 [Accipiter gentilis]XP_049669946.1 condensin-2 complex subunit H2 isoform X1 [Accipiter gentilis]